MNAKYQGLSLTQPPVLTLILTRSLTLSETIPSLPEIHFFYLSKEDIGLNRLLKAGVPCFLKYFKVVMEL